MAKKKTINSAETSTLSQSLRKLLDETFPRGVIEMRYSDDESDSVGSINELRDKIEQVEDASLVYERAPEPDMDWDDDDDEEPSLDNGFSASYHTFFVALTDKKFGFDETTDGEDEDGNPCEVAGKGRIGCIVAVSLLAPIAIVRFETMETYEDGSETMPEIDQAPPTENGVPITWDAHFEQGHGLEATRALSDLRGKLIQILESLRFTVLSAAEAEERVPWLKASKDIFLGQWKRPLTVRDAFFFQFP